MTSRYIRGITLQSVDSPGYPFSIPAVKNIETLQFDSPVTFLVGENGSGKSTIIEALAVAAGFNAEGGTKNYNYSTHNTTSELSEYIALVRGSTREPGGFFLRAESFYTTANYAEKGTSIPILFNGKHIHEQSHGEAFMSIINDFQNGLYIFDEPESALSPQRQLALLISMHRLAKDGAQFIIATHSPILLAFPEATIYELSDYGIERTNYDDTDHVKITRDFLADPKAYTNRLFKD